MAAVAGSVSSFVLRIAGISDLPGILLVEHACFAAPWTERMFAEEFGKDCAHVWVAERTPERTVGGFMVFWMAYDEIHVLNLATHPGSRRTGIARAMLASLHAFAKANSAAHVVLEVRPTNAAAIRLYQSSGYRPVGIRHRYYADNGEDAVVMVRVIQ